MNFRMVWIGPEDDSDAVGRASELLREAQRSSGAKYEQRGAEMARREVLADGRVKYTAVINFSARIVSDLLFDDDAAPRRYFGLEANIEGQKIAFVVAAAEFNRMGWVLNQLGPQAIIYPGQLQHARAAIQWLSGQIRQERIYTHLGWRKHGTDWVYLNAGGAAGARGSRADLRVELPTALQRYQVPPPKDPGELVCAVRASLRCLSLAPDRISFPLLAGVYRAALGNLDFSLFLTGPSGSFKTTLAALCQQHFGAEMDAGHLPASFASTSNSLEELAFHAKDALLVVDDFVPTGRSGDSELHNVAERLFRAAGNHQGRSRLGGAGQLIASRPPRALVLATGEEVPRGQSLRARLLILELGPGEVDRVRLSECQSAAQQGQLATAMGGFLRWIAGQYETVQERLRTRVQELRTYRAPDGRHARLPTTLAELRAGWELWLLFALEAGAIGAAEQAALRHRCERALDDLAVLQRQYHQASDPALRFVSLLQAALAGGHGHVANRLGKPPESPAIWGWQRKFTGRAWIPQGTRIGWIAGSDLFLDPALSYQVAQRAAGTERLLLSEQSLRHRLRESGLLASVDAGRQMLPVRRTLEGRPKQVLHLKTGDLLGRR